MDEDEHAFGTGLVGLVGRAIALVSTVFLAAFLFWAFVRAWSTPPAKEAGERVLQFLVTDALLVMAGFCALAALALIVPQSWSVKLVERRARRCLIWGVGVSVLVIVATLVVFLCEP